MQKQFRKPMWCPAYKYRGEYNMKFTLPHFGSEEVEIDPDTLINFPNGLPGLESCKHFKLFHSGDSPVIFWLQSIDDTSVVLSLTDPGSLQIFYDLALTDEEKSTLRIGADDDLQVAVILARQEESNINMKNVAQANFRSPIIINVSKQIAMQKILQNSELPICIYQPLFEASQDQAPSITGIHEASRMSQVAKDRLCSFAS